MASAHAPAERHAMPLKLGMPISSAKSGHRINAVSIAIIAWSALTIACATKAFLFPAKNTVFPIYTFAAGEWLAGRELYVKMPGYDYYRYSPLMAAFFVPWRAIDDAWGGAIWRILGASLLTWGIFRWMRDAGLPLSRHHYATVFLLVWPFALQNIHNGQSNVHMLGLLLLGIAEAGIGHCWRSAMWFALAALIKPYVLAIAGLVAVCQPRLFVRLAVTCLSGVLLTFLFQESEYVAEQYHDWYFHFFENDRFESPMRNWYRDLQLLFRIYLWPLPPRVYYLGSAVAGVAMAALVWVSRRANWNLRESLTLAAGLGGCWVTVLGPATESCTYLLLAPMLAVAVVSQSSWPGRWCTISYGLLAITITTALFPNNWKFQVLGPQPIAALIFLGVIIAQSCRRLQRPAESQFVAPSLAA